MRMLLASFFFRAKWQMLAKRSLRSHVENLYDRVMRGSECLRVLIKDGDFHQPSVDFSHRKGGRGGDSVAKFARKS